MNTARAGRSAEWTVRDLFTAAGFTVLRAASSKGPADLVALRAVSPPDQLVQVVCINVKAGKGWAPPDEREAMVRLIPSGCTRVLVRVNKIRGGKRRIGMRTPPPDWRLLDDEGIMREIPTWLRLIVEPAP